MEKVVWMAINSYNFYFRFSVSHAVEAMNEILSHSNEPITLVTLGPLTNIALLLIRILNAKTMLKKLL